MKWASNLPRRLGMLIATAVAALVFLIDIYTGNQVRVYPFYFIAIMLAAIFGTRPQSLGFAAFCAMLWLASKVLDLTPFTSRAVWIWNGAVQATSFLLVAYLVQRLAAALSIERRTADVLAERNQQLLAKGRELERLNTSLNSAIDAVEDAERISRHDLKTPLSSIVTAVDLMLSRPDLDAEEMKLLGAMKGSARRAIAMVNLSLNLHQMEEGRFIFVPQPVDLAEVIASVVADLDSHAEAKSVTVGVERPGAVTVAEAQAELCYSLLANLTRNAIEAAPENSRVSITFDIDPDWVRLSIANLGAVPQPVRERFFEKYATHGKPEGTGLGAYSARLIAEAMGGRLAMQTDDIAGTRLELVLKRARAPAAGASALAPAAVSATSAPSGRMSVLVVDDDEYNRLILTRMLPENCAPVTTAVNGRIAVEAARHNRPDVIFLDINMPVMGGIEALTAIRALQAAAGQRPSVIVAYSALDDPKSRARYLAHGFDAFLAKPCSRQEVMALLGVQAASAAAALSATADEIVLDADLLPLLEEFRKSRTALLHDLLDALREGRREAARQLAHQLGGSFGVFGFARASAACKEIESEVLAAELPQLARRAEEVLEHFAGARIRVADRAGHTARGGESDAGGAA